MTIATLVDQYAQARQARLDADKVAAKLGEAESLLKQQVVKEMEAAGLTTVGGAEATVTLRTKDVPHVTDWPAFYAYIKANDAFDLMQRRVHEGAWGQRREDGIAVPGTEAFPVTSLSVGGVR